MRYLIRCVPSRMNIVEEIRRHIPNLEILLDKSGNAMTSYLLALKMANNEPIVLLEDDIELTNNFCEKIESLIAKRPDEFQTFFSLSKKFTFSRYEVGSKFTSTLCNYFPKGMTTPVYEFYENWKDKEKHPTGTDLLVRDYMRANGIKFYIHCPSLVQHLPIVSVIDSRRSKYRQSVTFVKE